MTIAWIVNHFAGGVGIGSGWRQEELGRQWARRGLSARIFAASMRIGGSAGPGRCGDREIDGMRCSFVEVPRYCGSRVGRGVNMLASTRRSAAEIIASSPQHPSVAGCSGALPRRAFGEGFVSLPELRADLPKTVTLPVRTHQP